MVPTNYRRISKGSKYFGKCPTECPPKMEVLLGSVQVSWECPQNVFDALQGLSEHCVETREPAAEAHSALEHPHLQGHSVSSRRHFGPQRPERLL